MHSSEYSNEVVELEEMEIEVMSVRRERLPNSQNAKKCRRHEVIGTISTPVQRGRNWSNKIPFCWYKHTSGWSRTRRVKVMCINVANMRSLDEAGLQCQAARRIETEPNLSERRVRSDSAYPTSASARIGTS